MGMGSVSMYANNERMVALSETHCKFVAHFHCFLRRDLTWFETLPYVVSDYIALALIPSCYVFVLALGKIEFFVNSPWVTGIPDDEFTALRFGLIFRIAGTPGDGL